MINLALLPMGDTPAANMNLSYAVTVVVLLSVAVFQILLEAFLRGNLRRHLQKAISVIAVVTVLGIAIYQGYSMFAGKMPTGGAFWGSYSRDLFSVFFQMVILTIGLLSILVVADRARRRDGAFAAQASDRPGSAYEAYSLQVGYQRSEIFPLMLFSMSGMLLFVSTNSLLILFISLEIMSLPLYVMAAMARRRRLLSQEAGFKYFILGAFASGFFLMGIALIYGATGSVMIGDNSTAMQLFSIRDSWIVTTGMVFLLVGLLFKVGAVPFHAWTPDVYHGAPSPVTGFMAAGVKVAAFGAILRVIALMGHAMTPEVVVFLWVVAILTMLVGTFTGIVQSDIKRMLAYSSIAHAGFILIALVAPGELSFSSIVFYLISYGIATVGAFALISLVREIADNGDVLGEATALDRWRGLGKRHPWLAGAMLVFLLSFAGIPLTGGFVGKLLVFASGVHNGGLALVLIAVFSSAVTAFFYFRLAALMYFEEPDANADIPAGDYVTKGVIIVCALATIALGIAPDIVLGILL